MQTANDEVTTILMIEHIDAVRNIDEILQVKGVDYRRIKEGFTNIILGLDVLYLLGGATTALSQVERPR